ncbi:uncharacterized protein K460DRAFT_397377 [Cucurbitaria berberidis CBS 394.84]|uniref:Uncharacterized protein n=1 Tax=Cucurbitaria berberidis CBS 394.84 TaxID=1168544 RepID=A0A9P4GE16_9PLEO|nr:uncharacterized protein K460DRAFT_397377 [Cucurbitaria berberidis CBS 394.84]KAF1844243.1 hypothetical protein K460DRAFT_397377 [Cucurbitaria berberidis CBS 394.84]
MQSTDDQRFTASYTACDPLSCFHDLQCGHRIQVQYSTEHCGLNCLNPRGDKPFVCADCLVAHVRLEMSFEGLDLTNVGDDVEMGNNGASREEQIQKIADTELKKLLAQGRRMSKIAPKFKDPKLQFFHQFLLEEGYEGLENDANVRLPPGTPYKRPGIAKEKSKTSEVWKPRDTAHEEGDADEQVNFTLANFEQDWESVSRGVEQRQVERHQGQPVIDNRLNGLLEQFSETRVGLSVEDDATRASPKGSGPRVVSRLVPIFLSDQPLFELDDTF